MAARLVLLLLLASCASFQAAEMEMRANPIRKVVTMLQSMTKKVEDESKQETELFHKFMCHCKTGGEDLEKSIADAQTAIPNLESDIEASTSKKTQLDKDLDQHKSDRSGALKAMGEANALREKESASFQKETAEDKAEMSQMEAAIASLEGGLGSSFLQTPGAEQLRQIVLAQQDAEDADKQKLVAFLGNDQGAPGTSEVIGILKQMHDEYTKTLADATAAESEAQANHAALTAAKKKEVRASTKMIEEKLQRVGQLATEIESMKNELEDTKERLAEDSKMMATLKKSCATKEGEFKASQKLMQQELVALAETIKVLNDDDALELFKKTLPSGATSFLQIPVTSKEIRSRALHVIGKAQARRGRSVQLDFIALALHGKKVGFDGVIKMIDDLAHTLRGEQQGDDRKKAYCAEEFDKSDDKKKGLERKIKDTNSAIGKAKEDTAAMEEAIVKLAAGIKALDRSVAEATEQRKEEHSEYVEIMANNNAAKEVLGFAKNRLNKFYNPKLYKAPPKRDLSEEDSIVVNMGGTLAPTAAPGGIAGTGIEAASFLQVQAHHRQEPAARQESNGVLEMMDLLIADIDKELTESEVTEKDSQADYEQSMKNAQAKRATDAKALAESQSEKADLEASLEELDGTKKAATKELMATEKYIVSLHSECDWLLQYYDVRKEARANELDSLSKAKDVLHGADYSFLQLMSSRTRGGFLRFA
jgi:chromosome segregation ATPase